jgi:chloramphenicol-sensitive protein RarD
VSEQRRGLIYGAAAYLLWGVFPLYFPLLEPASALEILANRIVWSLVVVLILLAIRRRWSWLRDLRTDRRRLLLLTGAAITIALNWGTYIYGVNSNQVVETSLGYFINPLVTVAFGVVLLNERLRRLQWMAVGLGAFAVVVLAVDYGHPPWIALILAFSFGTYGLLKRIVNMGAVESLTVETGLLFFPALACLVVLNVQGTSTLQQEGLAHAALLSTTGLITAIPLLFFGAAAIRIPLTWIGLLQYIAPVLQFLIGIFVFDEAMPTSRWIGFCLVWLALMILTFDSIRAARRGRIDIGDQLDVDAAEAH